MGGFAVEVRQMGQVSCRWVESGSVNMEFSYPEGGTW
jgi:hypothetical protein